MEKDLVRISKFLSLILRHKPEKTGVVLDRGGWVNVDELLEAANKFGVSLDVATLRKVVAQNDKNRFTLSEDGRIRANQGHSVSVDLGLEPVQPPEILYHGTAARFLESIRRKGLHKGKRHHVHLSPDEQTALKVGRRHGKPVVLVVHAGCMQRDGFQFCLSKNGIWLTESVPAEYIQLAEQGSSRSWDSRRNIPASPLG